jgi:hypothetical protein
VEFVKDLAGIEGRFGITTVQPNRALKICKIRNLRVEYFQSPFAVTLVIPKACVNCEQGDECSDDFILQIMEKNSKPRDAASDAYSSLDFWR